MKQRRKRGLSLMAICLMIIGSGFIARANADWSLPLQVFLNNSPATPFPMELGMRGDATDYFDLDFDAVAPPPNLNGEEFYFLNIAGEQIPRNKLLADYRANSSGVTVWKVIIKIAPGHTFKMDWANASLPGGVVLTWQWANGSWTGLNPIHYFTDYPRQIELTNDDEDMVTITKRILIKAN
jgi:hypothetical protein